MKSDRAKKLLISIIIPVRKEEKAIIKTLESIKKSVKSAYEIIVVDDSIEQSDATISVVKRYARGSIKIKAILKSHGKDIDGFGGAIMRGVASAKANYIVFIMGDACDNPFDIDRMYKRIIEGYDIVCGSRYMPGGKKEGGPLFQGIFSSIVNSMLHFFTKIPTSDISNSFKMYKRNILKNLKIDPHSGVECTISLVFQGWWAGAKINEIPTYWRGRTDGKSKFRILNQFPKYLRLCILAIGKTMIIKFRHCV